MTLWGGAVERRWRQARPDIEALPWTALDARAFSEAELIAARREWTDASLHEYASAGHFAITLRALMRAQAPLDLCAALARFPVDEIAHGELCARMAVALGGGTPLDFDPDVVYALPTPDEEARDPRVAAGENVVRGLCVSESFSHAIIRALADEAALPLARALWSRVLADENEHAGLGWAVLEWLVPELDDAARARLSGAARAQLAELEAALAGVRATRDGVYSRAGIIESIGRARYLDVAAHAIESRVVKPLARHGIDAR